MARLSSRTLGRRSVADKLWSLLRQLGPRGEPALRQEFIDVNRGFGVEESELSAEDAADFTRYVRPISAVSTVLAFFDGAPVGQLPALYAAVHAADTELGSGGPPISPVHDSLFVTWNALDLRIGRTNETMASITRALLRNLKMLPQYLEQLKALEAESLGVFTVQDIRPARVGESSRFLLRDVVTERELWVQFLEDYDIRVLDFVMVRPTLLPAEREALREVSHLCFTTPYVLRGQSLAAWWDYFERAAGELGVRLNEASYSRVMRGEGNPRRWLDFVFEGYVGQRHKNVVEIVGLPDLPHTLPHHQDYDASADDQIPPHADPTTRSQYLIARTLRQLRGLGDQGLPAIAPEIIRLDSLGEGASWAPMLISIALSEGTANTRPLIDILQNETVFDDDMQEWVAAVRAGTTSLFDVISVHKGHGMHVRDVLGGRTLDLVESSGSQSLAPGFLLFGRVVHYRGIDMFENVHSVAAPPGAKDSVVAAVRRTLGGEPMRGAVAVKAAAAWQEALEHWEYASVPKLMTTTGEPLVMCLVELSFAPARQGEVVDAVRRMRRSFEVESEEGPGVLHFQVLTKSDMVEARIAIAENAVLIESNARERLDRVVARLRSKVAGLSVLRRSQILGDEIIRTALEREKR